MSKDKRTSVTLAFAVKRLNDALARKGIAHRYNTISVSTGDQRRFYRLLLNNTHTIASGQVDIVQSAVEALEQHTLRVLPDPKAHD